MVKNSSAGITGLGGKYCLLAALNADFKLFSSKYTISNPIS